VVAFKPLRVVADDTDARRWAGTRNEYQAKRLKHVVVEVFGDDTDFNGLIASRVDI